MGSTRILLVDDDQELCQLLTEYLESHELQVDSMHSAEPVLRLKNITESYDLICLDIMMPGMSGLELLPALRAMSTIPIIMVTGRGDDIDRVIGLEMGADDYIAKPCNPRELLARIKAVLRRTTEISTNSSFQSETSDLDIHGLSISPSRREVKLNDELLQLTGAEFDILWRLMQMQGQVISKADLTEKVLHRALTRYDRSIDVHVSRLRHKLCVVQPEIEWIKTVRGSGYIFVASERDQV